MKYKETLLGITQDVTGTTVRFSLTSENASEFIYINGQGYRIGQIGSFVRIPVGFIDLFGIITQVGANSKPNNIDEDSALSSRWMTIQLIGEGQRNGNFQRGITQYPTIGDEVHLVSEKELVRIYGQPDKPYFVKIGSIANADSIPALLDVNKLITRHSAIVGTTGSGKSTTVASIINALTDKNKYPSSRVIIIDIHGEYGNAFKGNSNIFKVNASKSTKQNEKELSIPFWALNFDELCEISFGNFNDEKDRNIVMERIQKAKSDSLVKYPLKGLTDDTLNIDSPVPFSIHNLWYEMYIETFGTYYKKKAKGRPLDNLAYDFDKNNNKLEGNPFLGIPPVFKNVKNDKEDDEKIFYLPNTLNLGKQLLLLGAKLRIPRYDFIFKPSKWLPKEDGKIEQDIDQLLVEWIGSPNNISIFDLSGVPSDILQTIIGVLFRLIYESLFWSRNLSQGGRYRPLLLVMEEAHLYLNNESKNMASKIVQRIAKEGRKYGIGAMVVSQRPSEVNSTILSQCGTFITMRLANSTDRNHITSALPDNLEGLTNMLPILRTGEAIILGEAVKLPMRTLITPPPMDKRPDSQDPIVYDEINEDDSMHPGGWGIKMEGNPNYEELIESWRAHNPRISKIIENLKGEKK